MNMKLEDLQEAKKQISDLVEKLKKSKELSLSLSENIPKLEALIKNKDPANCVLLPENKEHPDLLIPFDRLSYDLEVQAVAQKLGLQLKDNEQVYIGDITFEQAQELCLHLDGFMITPLYFAEFLRTLRSGKAFDGNGKKIQKSRLEKASNEITESRSWKERAEWLNQRYSRVGSEIKVTYPRFINGNLEIVTEPLDEDTLREDKRISLEDWINNLTLQGLPRKIVKEGELWYWHPTENKVAGFYAFTNMSYLNCVEDPSVSDPDISIRIAKTQKK